MEDNKNDIELTGKVAMFPKNTKATKALKFLEHVKINPNKLWYIVIEDQGTDLKMVKYNRSKGVNLLQYTMELKNYYLTKFKDDLIITEQLNNIIVVGENDFSVIKNIPQLKIGNQTLISKITTDLIKLLGE